MTSFSCTFDPNTPTDCPPPEARQSNQTVYRCIENDPAQLDDFVSDVQAKRRNSDPSNCQSWGCSVWVDENAVENALGIFKFFKKKFIVKGDIGVSDGAMLNTPSNSQPDHYTFWQAAGVDVSGKFSVFIEKGRKV